MILSAIRELGIEQRQIAKAINRSNTLVSFHLRGKRSNPEVLALIESYLTKEICKRTITK